MASNLTKPSTCKRLFVAAIDFGTTYSGYAFSSKSEWTKVQTNVWTGSNQMSAKTPTALLLNSDKTFEAFGYEAENRFTEIVEEGEQDDYFYFHRFKMLLHNCSRLTRDILIKDVSGKTLEAHLVFSLSIRYLKDDLYKKLKNSVPDTTLEDIHFVLTVPAIWEDAAKQFMREAAETAGIKANQLSIALEPEAASIYCQHIPTEIEVDGNQSFLKTAKPGTKYMILDLGGGTADITVHCRTEDGFLDEVAPASGGPWGGKAVDDAFTTFLKDVVTGHVLDKLRDDSMEDYIDLFREFESKKRSEAMKSGKVHMKIPLQLQSIAKKEMGKTLKEALENTKYGDLVHFANMKIHMSADVFRELFMETVNGIKNHIKELFHDKKIKDVSTILMVGGFSECELVQKAIKDAFPNKRVIIPEEPGLAVLKGAVYYGHIPNTIRTRIARFTYGIQSWPEFDPTKHPPQKKVMLGGTARCKDVFFVYIKKGAILTPGHRRSQIFQALKPEEKCLECAIYVSDKEDPKFVDEDNCRRLGILNVPLPVIRAGSSLEIEETMIFGETEVRVQARDIYTNQQCEVKFDLLSSGS